MDYFYGGIYVVLGILFLAWAFQSFRVIDQTNVGVVETLGRFSSIKPAGFAFIWAPIQRMELMSLQIQDGHTAIKIKSKDSQFIELPITTLIRVQDVFKAYYELINPKETIDALILNVVRPIASEMTLEALFNDRTALRDAVIGSLAEKIARYGYEVVDVLVDQPTLSSDAEEVFNRVLLADKKLQAATAESEAKRISIEIEAKAEAEGQRLRAQGLADARTILANSLKESINNLGVPQADAINLLLETNRIDMLRVVARESSNLIILDTNKQVPVIVNQAGQL